MNPEKIERDFSPTPDGVCSQARLGMVAAAFPEAARAGAQMLEKGGNAVDAAAAAALCLGVCEPQASGLGGQSMALIHLDGKAICLDGSGRVPALARVELFGPEDHKIGYKATSVPTTVAVLGYMVKKYGRLKWCEVVRPALEAAADGYRITKLQNRLQTREIPNFAKVASGSGARYFLKNANEAYSVGEVFKQPDLAGLLERLADKGPEAFYRGETAQKIDEDMRANKGFLRAEDLKDVPWPKERPALSGSYRGLEIVSCPPPTAGRSLFGLMNLLEGCKAEELTDGSPEAAWRFAGAVRQVLKERRAASIHPDKYDPAQDPLLEKGAAWAKGLGAENTPGDAGGQTTHVSAMDRWGNAVGITQSVNLVYASKAAADGLGFLYNDYLLDCNQSDPSHPTYLGPGGMPASSVIPAIVMREGRPWLITGSPGTERILSTVAGFLIHIIDGGLPLDQAMKEPRLHYSPEGVLTIEAGRFERDVVEYLKQRAEKFEPRQDYSFYLGAIHSVLRCQTREGFQGVAEMRRDGIAAGC